MYSSLFCVCITNSFLVKFALNEISFFLVRLYQNFDHVELALEAQPADSKPPSEWKEAVGRKAFEKVMPKVHITTYCTVSPSLCICSIRHELMYL